MLAKTTDSAGAMLVADVIWAHVKAHSLNEARWFESLCIPADMSHQGSQAQVHACSIVWRPLLSENIKDTTYD